MSLFNRSLKPLMFGELYICSSFRGTYQYKFFNDYGVHPTLGVSGHAFVEPQVGPIDDIRAVEQYFIEEDTGIMWTWNMATRDWLLMPDWLEFCDIPVLL